MKSDELEKKLHEQLEEVLNLLEKLRAEFDAVYANDDEQVHIDVNALGDNYFTVTVTITNGAEYHSIVNGRKSFGEWKEFPTIKGSFFRK